MREALDAMKSEKIPFDIIVPYDSGYNGLANHTFNAIKELGYNPKKDVDDDCLYQIFLTPYPGLEVTKRANFVYHIRYPYSVLSAKPNPVYLPDAKIDYDAMLFFNVYEPNFLCAYGAKCFSIPCWKYKDFYSKKKTKKEAGKPVLLILPTFGQDISCINLFTDSLIKKIKSRFFVIAKAHHAVDFGIDGDEPIQRLRDISDEFYDSSVSIVELLKKADVVVSDSSGAIFEAIYAGVPVVSFTRNINQRHLGNIDTYQYALAKRGILPHADSPDKLIKILNNSVTYKNKQANLRREIFLDVEDNSVNEFIRIIKSYLKMDASSDYYKILHDAMVKEWRDDKETILNLNKAIENIHNSTSWKVTAPLRSLKRRRK